METEIELRIKEIDIERDQIAYIKHTLKYPAIENSTHRQSINFHERIVGKETFDRVQKMVSGILTEHLKVSESKLKALLNL